MDSEPQPVESVCLLPFVDRRLLHVIENFTGPSHWLLHLGDFALQTLLFTDQFPADPKIRPYPCILLFYSHVSDLAQGNSPVNVSCLRIDTNRNRALEEVLASPVVILEARFGEIKRHILEAVVVMGAVPGAL